jgi:hypothetical protein
MNSRKLGSTGSKRHLPTKMGQAKQLLKILKKVIVISASQSGKSGIDAASTSEDISGASRIAPLVVFYANNESELIEVRHFALHDRSSQLRLKPR